MDCARLLMMEGYITLIYVHREKLHVALKYELSSFLLFAEHKSSNSSNILAAKIL